MRREGKGMTRQRLMRCRILGCLRSAVVHVGMHIEMLVIEEKRRR